MLLHSLEIKNYRSLKDVKLNNLQQFNVLIGRNNVGKSSIFLALYDLNRILTTGSISSDILTGRDARQVLEITVTFQPRQREREDFVDILRNLGLDAQRQTAVLSSPLLRKVQFSFKSVSLNPGLLHLRETRLLAEDGKWAIIQRMEGEERVSNPQYRYTGFSTVATQPSHAPFIARNLDIDQGQHNNTIQVQPASIMSTWAQDPATQWIFDRFREYFSNAFFFNPFRHSTASMPIQGTMTLNQDGSNLAQVLHTINSNDRVQFQKIEQFVHGALPDVGQLQAPVPIGTNATEVSFKQPAEYYVRLHEMGGGIEQLLMVATVLLTTGAEHPLFLEEPESHLHAGAQRFLLEKLYDEERQVFITTHSPTFINLSRPHSLYQVTYTKGQTAIKQCDATSLDVVLEDIGVRNSDVLLSDAVLFVEGPGDRDVLSIFSEKLGMNLAEHNINVLPMGGGKHAERGAPIRSELLKDISQKAPIRHLFVLDRDERRKEEIHSLEERLGTKVYFFRARELENYLLVPRAILSALSSKLRDSALPVDRLATVTEEQIEKLIHTTANDLYNTILIKRIRTEIGGLREGLLPSEALSSLTADAKHENLAERVLKEIKSQWEHRLAGLNIDLIVSTERETLDAEWRDPEKRLQLAPGEEILAAVFRAFGFEYNKPTDTARIAKEMQVEEIQQEIIEIITKAWSLTGS